MGGLVKKKIQAHSILKKKKYSSPFSQKPNGPRVANKIRPWSLSPATKLEKEEIQVVCPCQNHQNVQFLEKKKNCW